MIRWDSLGFVGIRLDSLGFVGIRWGSYGVHLGPSTGAFLAVSWIRWALFGVRTNNELRCMVLAATWPRRLARLRNLPTRVLDHTCIFILR